MDTLFPCTSKIFLIYGINLTKFNHFLFLVRIYISSSLLSGLIFATYRLVTDVHHIPIDAVHCVFMPLLAIQLVTIQRTSIKIRRMLNACFKVLSQEAIDRIKNRDKTWSAVLGIFIATIYVLITIHNVSDGGEQLLSLVLGIKKMDEFKNDPIKSNVFMAAAIMLPIMSFYLHAGHWLSIMYYTMVQYTLKEFANDCLDFVRKPKRSESKKINQVGIIDFNENGHRGNLEDILVRLKFYNDLVADVNELISVIPFASLVYDFCFIMSGICFVVIYDSKFSPLFILSTVGAMSVFNIILLNLLIKNSCDAFDTMEKVWRETIKLLSSSDQGMIRIGTVGDKYYHNLSMYLSKEKVSQSTIWNLFKIKRTLLLSFASQVIPMTIMIITTWHGFKPIVIN